MGGVLPVVVRRTFHRTTAIEEHAADLALTKR
jgi:hypothetical protein